MTDLSPAQMEGAWYDASSGAYILNESDLPTHEVMTAMRQQHPEMALMQRWGESIGSHGRSGSLFNRDRFVTPTNIFDQFKVAYDAANNDDVVAGSLDITEALAFGWLDMEAEVEDEADVWNQIVEDMELHVRLKEIWREMSITSNCTVACAWGRKEYKVRGRSDKGVKKKKTYNVLAPISLKVIDPLKVVPVGNSLFGNQRLAYQAETGEASSIENVLAGDNTTDLTILEVFESKYIPQGSELMWLSNLGIDVRNLFLLREDRVWRITATKPAYERFASPRLKCLFDILDMKAQLKEMDRAHLIGATNFIILIKKGSEKDPARPAELAGLNSAVRSGSRVPVIVGDHRLSIEIITPKTDLTLKPERYNMLDSRIASRVLGLSEIGNYSSGAKGDDSVKQAKVIARGLETRRSDLIQSIWKNMIKPTMERNESLESGFVRLQYHPKRIALDLDPALMVLLQDLRDRGDLSRESILDEAGYEQSEEARKREREAELYDEIFAPVVVPFSSPNQPGMNPAEQKQAGRTGGGNKNGGGENPDSRQPNSNQPTTPKPKGPAA